MQRGNKWHRLLHSAIIPTIWLSSTNHKIDYIDGNMTNPIDLQMRAPLASCREPADQQEVIADCSVCYMFSNIKRNIF